VTNSCGNNPSGDVELTMLLATIDTSKHKSINLFISLVHFKTKFEFIILKFKNRFHKFLKKNKTYNFYTYSSTDCIIIERIADNGPYTGEVKEANNKLFLANLQCFSNSKVIDSTKNKLNVVSCLS
jgi:hypothetical protein